MEKIKKSPELIKIAKALFGDIVEDVSISLNSDYNEDYQKQVKTRIISQSNDKMIFLLIDGGYILVKNVYETEELFRK